jgi:hypothetical protein
MMAKDFVFAISSASEASIFRIAEAVGALALINAIRRLLCAV